jgi:tetratricopeptide (TPR) repeat protein
MRRGFIIALIALGLTVVAGAGSQSAAREPRRSDQVQTELSLARQALVMGNVDEAVRLSEDLYRRYPDDDRVFWALVKTYEAAELDEERLIPLLEGRLSRTPEDDRVLMELGEAHARLADFERAHEVWLERARMGRPDVVRYSEVGALEVRYRMYESAVEVYLEGRRIGGKESFFSEELAQLYTILGEHEKAIDECFTTAREHPGMDQWSANRIEQMLDDGADERMVRRRMDAVVSAERPAPSELTLAGSVLLALGSPDDALEAFLRADEMAGVRGRMLMEFAEILRDEGLPSKARDAYRLIVEQNPGTVNAGIAGIRSARLLVELDRAVDAVDELEALAADLPGHPIRSEALLEKAGIELEMLREPDAALATLDRIAPDAPLRTGEIREEIEVLTIDVLLALGRLSDAGARAEALLEAKPREATRQRARYTLGYVAFLELDAETALTELRTLVENDPSGVLVNDALRLMLVVSDAQETGDMGPLRRFADAHAAVLSYRPDEAESQLEALVASAGISAIASEALMLLGEVRETAGELRKALETYAAAAEEGRTLATRAEALMRRGRILSGPLGRPGDALNEYLTLIEGLPANFLTGEARRRAEAIRREEGLRG